jgi:hypothetical protein
LLPNVKTKDFFPLFLKIIIIIIILFGRYTNWVIVRYHGKKKSKRKLEVFTCRVNPQGMHIPKIRGIFV